MQAHVDLRSSSRGEENDIQGASVQDHLVEGATTIAGLAPGTYEVWARFENGAEARTRLDLPRREPLILRAAPGGDLIVSVRLLGLPDQRFPSST